MQKENKPTPTAQYYKMTKLELFVWNNPHADFQQIATLLNRSLRSIEQAYDRAKKKNAAQII